MHVKISCTYTNMSVVCRMLQSIRINDCLQQGCAQAVYLSQLRQSAAYVAHITLSVAFAWMQYFAHLSMRILLFYSCVVQSHCFSITSVHHSLMCVLFCSALLCLPSSSSSSSCILSGLPVPGAFCIFSCACPSPSRSKHRGAHSDPSGGETTEDQPPAQAGGGQRYGSGLNRMCLGKSCVVSFFFVGFMKLRFLW